MLPPFPPQRLHVCLQFLPNPDLSLVQDLFKSKPQFPYFSPLLARCCCLKLLLPIAFINLKFWSSELQSTKYKIGGILVTWPYRVLVKMQVSALLRLHVNAD